MNLRGLTVLAVDDEQAQLNDLARLLRASPHVQEVECCSDSRDALTRLSSQRFDAIFLDVRMPGIDGLGLARVLGQFREHPAIVFVSAYDNSAVDTFELNAVDYLRKPVSRGRAAQALERVLLARAQREAEPPAETHGAEDLVAVGNPRTGASQLLARAEIRYVQAQGDFVRVVAPAGRFLIRSTLAEVEAKWATYGFIRVHRQYLANLRHAREIRPSLGTTADLVMDDGSAVPIARRNLAELQRRLRP